MRPDRFQALDALRGVAALTVMGFHFQGTLPALSNEITRSSWLFVDFFFVLSGFVLAPAFLSRLAGASDLR